MAYTETSSLEDAIGELDILYMTRIQRERFDNMDDYEMLKDSYILDTNKLKTAKSDMCILHPLPRVNEISVEVDKDPRACYFKQVLNGKYMRMALILKLLNEAKSGVEESRETDIVENKIFCSNPRCITSCEQELAHVYKLMDKDNGIYRCIYCEAKAKMKEEN
jgi:aspartate carbamoyltransferase catalytic subunit